MIVIQNQSLLDIAIQEDGSVLAAFDWAFVNGLSITDALSPGQSLIAPNSVYKNTEVANYFKGKTQQLATAFYGTIDVLIPELGIGTMTIGSTFIVR